MSEMIDTHAHYDDEAFEQDRDALLESFPKYGIEKVINSGASVSSSLKGMQLAEKWPFVYCALGVHPNETKTLTEEALHRFETLARREKVVAIGEIGLDYHYEEPEREIQAEWFRKQIRLAKRVNLPIIVHSRDAVQDTIQILREEKASDAGGVIHCFSAGKEVAEEYVKMGFFLGIGGVITFKNGKKLKEVVKSVPMEAILLETDCPYLSPEPNRGKRNSSRNLPYVVEEIARLKGICEQEVIEITTQNAIRCFPKLQQKKGA